MAKSNSKKDEAHQAVDAAIASIERMFGKGAIMRIGDAETPQIASIPTGSLAVDMAIGVGGFPRGRVVEVFGPESSGKTTLALSVVAGLAASIGALRKRPVEVLRSEG